MIQPRILKETAEISLYELMQLAMHEGLDLRDVFVGYAGCGSHQVGVWGMDEFEKADGTEPITRVPVDGEVGDYDPEVGF